MAGFSNSLANAIVNSTLRGMAFPTIRTTHFALFTADPTDAFNAGAEVSAPWYKRKAAGAFSAPTEGRSYNTTQAAFAPVTGAPVTVTHIGIVEGASDSDPTSTLLYTQQLAEPKTLNVNDVYVVDTQGTGGDFALVLL